MLTKKWEVTGEPEKKKIMQLWQAFSLMQQQAAQAAAAAAAPPAPPGPGGPDPAAIGKPPAPSGGETIRSLPAQRSSRIERPDLSGRPSPESVDRLTRHSRLGRADP
jgi:hypothetical protein